MYRTATIQLEDQAVLHAVSAGELAIHVGDQCVVESGRAPEFGRVTRLAEHEGDLPARNGGALILRRATLHDQAKAKENAVVGHMSSKTVHKRVEEAKLPVHLVQIRYSFDRTILHITYTSEERVECPDLIRALAAELHARIEMRQIGVRDAARLVGGMGPCGRQLCCRVWRQDFDTVSVKMAKAQRLALNPGTIGGVCGRLKCCLKYEFDCYRRQGEHLPKDGACVRCPGGRGWVADKDILAQRVKVRLEDGRMLAFDAAEVSAMADAEAKGGTGEQESEE
jgi:cell fate regulator YaaT (PSP1 superfamily)